MSDYNGWTNYETWCVNMWLSNDQGTYHDVLGQAGELIGDESDSYGFVEWLKDYVRELPEAADVLEWASFVSDLLGAALSEVNWYEIAEHWFADAREIAEADA